MEEKGKVAGAPMDSETYGPFTKDNEEDADMGMGFDQSKPYRPHRRTFPGTRSTGGKSELLASAGDGLLVTALWPLQAQTPFSSWSWRCTGVLCDHQTQQGAQELTQSPLPA